MATATRLRAGMAQSHGLQQRCQWTLRPPSVQRRTACLQCSAEAASSSEVAAIPPGCSRYSISIKKPLGIVLEQRSTGGIYVAEVSPTGSAAATGLVTVGDQLIATSGVTFQRETNYGGVWVKQGQQIVRLNALGESMKTVSAAIGSHPGHMAVTLEFQRCDPSNTLPDDSVPGQ